MIEQLPTDIEEELMKACELHQRATSDYAQCEKFSKLMSDLLARLEGSDCHHTADKVMSILIDCNPKIGAHCEKASTVGARVEKLGNGRKSPSD